MKLPALVAVVALVLACGAQSPEPPPQPAAFHSQHSLYTKAVDDGSTYLTQLVAGVTSDPAAAYLARDRPIAFTFSPPLSAA